MRYLLRLLLLAAWASGTWGQETEISVPLDEGWNAAPEWCAYEQADRYSQSFHDGYASFRASGGKGTMIWVRHAEPRLNVGQMGYVTLRYRSQGIDPVLYSYLLYLDTGDSGGMYARNLIFAASDLIHDGQWHTATTQLYPFGEIGTLALRFRALEGQEGRLDVAYLRFSATPPRAPLSEFVQWEVGDTGVGSFGLDLGGMLNESQADAQRALDLADWFPEARVAVDGVNFQAPVRGLGAVATTDKGNETITVPVAAQGGALYLLMGAKFPYKMLNYAGWNPGDMTERPEQFQVSIRYADGTVEEQVPYCLSRRAYGVWRGLRTYCLPLDPTKTVRDFTLHDGMVYSSFHLLAATVGETSLAPAQAEAPVRTPAGQGPGKMKPAVLRQGRAILMQGPWGELAFGLTDAGLTLTAMDNAAHPSAALKIANPCPIFVIREGDQTWSSADFTITDPGLDFEGTTGEIHFAHPEARLGATLVLHATAAEARLKLFVVNQGGGERSLRVTFPQVVVNHPWPADVYYFYPTSSPVWSNAEATYDKPYSGWFPVQFADVYDRRAGGGLYVGTRDTSLRQRYYQLTKSGGSVRLRVEYRDNPPVQPEEAVACPPAVIGLHGGDWRPAYNAYAAWLKTWYRPSHPRPEWYRHVWNFRTWWTHTMGDGSPDHNLLNRQTGEFQTEAFVRRDRELYGDVDMVHFFDWRISPTRGTWGDYTYDGVGGLEAFRGAIQVLQREGIRVGLYLDCYLCSEKSDIGKAHGREWAAIDIAGNPSRAYSTPEEPMYGMCVLHPGWQDHLAQTCARVARDTGCDGIYLDEGMTDSREYWCYSPDHGHAVPGVNQLGLIELARKVRERLPEGVALYTEWSPPDAMVPYLDGAYQANLAHCDIHQSPGFLQLARFVFPDFRVFTISNAGGMSDGIWEGLKYSLFSGVPLYTLSWGHDEAVYPLVRKMSAILHDHEAAFLTTTPKPFVPTERADLFANRFPGPKETVWTLWNARYRTLTGPVLRVAHVSGARYLDLWNERELHPSIGKDGIATLSTTLGPRGIGVVAQVRP